MNPDWPTRMGFGELVFVRGWGYAISCFWSLKCFEKVTKCSVLFCFGRRETHFKDMSFLGIFWHDYRQFLWSFWVVCERDLVFTKFSSLQETPCGFLPWSARMSTPEMLMTNDGASSTGATGAAVVLVTAAVGMLAAGARSLKVTRKLVAKGGRWTWPVWVILLTPEITRKIRKSYVWKNCFKENLSGVVLHCLRDGVALFEGWCRWYLIWKKMI